MRPGLVRLHFGAERCCGVIVSNTHVLTSKHQLFGATTGFVDDDTPHVVFPSQVVSTHPEADLAVVAVSVIHTSWAPQRYGGGAQPPFGQLLGLSGFSAGPWAESATCLRPACGREGFVVACRPLGAHSVPCIGDSGSPAWAAGVVVGVCSAPVTHVAGCRDAQMRYTFIDDDRGAWIDGALRLPYRMPPSSVRAGFSSALAGSGC